MRLTSISSLMLTFKNRGKNNISHAYDEVKATPELRVSNKPHRLIKKTLLTSEPIHWSMGKFFVNGVKVKTYRRRAAQYVSEDRFQFIPRRLGEKLLHRWPRIMVVNNLIHLAIDRYVCSI